MPEPAPKPSEQAVTWLAEAGHEGTVDEDGDVVFVHEGKTWILFLDAEDPEFFRLVLPNIWPIESEAERQAVLAACSEANGRIKTAKLYTVNDNVWVGVEQFVPHGDWRPFLERGLAIIRQATNLFVGQMRR